MVKFNKNGIIKAKNHPINCIVRDKKYYLIVIITYDKYIFSIKNRIKKA